MEADARVPDVAGEVLGWRAWYVKPVLAGRPRVVYPSSWCSASAMGLRHRLVSLYVPVAWPTDDWMRAHCTKTINDVPHAGCCCGIYAVKELADLSISGYADYDPERGELMALGQVALAGKVIPHARGFRAEKARPVRIFLPYENWDECTDLGDDYGVPVDLTRFPCPVGRD